MRRQSTIMLVALSLLIAPWNAALGQEVDTVRDVSLLTLQEETRRSEQNLIRLFNSQNGISKFNIRCQKIRRTGSYFSKRVCAPVFMFRSFSQYGGLLTTGFNILTDEVNWSSTKDDQIREFSMVFTDVMFRNNEFTYALVEFTQLNEQYNRASNPVITLR